MIQLVQLKRTKYTIVVVNFTKAVLHVSAHEGPVGECKHYGIMICSGIYGLVNHQCMIYIYIYTQGDSVARGPKLLSIKNCVIEIMT